MIRTAVLYQLSYQTDWELATLSYEVIGFQTRELGPDYMANFSLASETNPLKIKLSITWRGIQPGRNSARTETPSPVFLTGLGFSAQPIGPENLKKPG